MRILSNTHSEHKNKVPEVRGCFKTCSDAQNSKYLPHVLI